MSSKQIFKLPIILEDSEKTINDYHMREECRKRAIIYEIKQKQIKSQIQLAKVSKELQDHILTNSAAKLALVESLIPLLNKQSNIFNTERHSAISTAYKHLQDLDTMPATTEKLAVHASELNGKIMEFARQITYLESGQNVHF